MKPNHPLTSPRLPSKWIAFDLKMKIGLRPDLHANLRTYENLSEVRVCVEFKMEGGEVRM